MDKLLEILQKLHPDVNYPEVEDLWGEGVLDSLDMVRLITEIDRAFDVRIPPEALLPENFKTVSTILSLIERLDEE